MPTISQLSAVTSLSTGDNIVIQSAANNDARKASLSVLLAFFEAQFASPEFTTEINAPTSSGFNLQMVATTDNMWMIINPTGAFAAGTLTLPPVADCFDGQQIVVTCSAAITAFTVAGNGATVTGAPTSLGTGGFFALRFNALQDTWYCVSQSLGSTNVFTDITVTNAILDTNGNEQIKFIATASAVNEVTVVNGATGTGATIASTGVDTNVDLLLVAKGTGKVFIDGTEAVAVAGAQTLTDKTLTGPITDAIKMGGAGTSTVALLNIAYPPATSRGFRTVVIDASTTLLLGLGTTVSGSGANIAPVFCDGVTWKYG